MYLLTAYCNDPISMEFMAGTIAPMVMTGIAMMVFMLALYYMAAAVFKKNEWESTVSIETHQALVSLLLFLLAFGAACFASQIADSFAGGDQFAVAQNYLDMISNQVSLPALINLQMTKIAAQYWASMSFRWGLAVWGATVPGFPSFVVIERVIEFLLLLLSPFVASLMVQSIGLEVIKAIAIPFMLPAGVVLRIFPPTRDAGSFLIASALAFGIVFPYTYVMHASIVNAMIQEDENANESLDALLGPQYPNLLSIANAWGIWSADRMLFQPIRALSYMVLQAIFLPALSITLTIAFIKGTTKFISQKME